MSEKYLEGLEGIYQELEEAIKGMSDMDTQYLCSILMDLISVLHGEEKEPPFE